MFAVMSGSQCNVRKTPVPTPATTPVGPYKLSIQPMTGSRTDDVTIAGRNIPNGNFLQFNLITDSAKALVNAYVFGHLPSILWKMPEKTVNGKRIATQ